MMAIDVVFIERIVANFYSSFENWTIFEFT
jgi:hypothetical protein